MDIISWLEVWKNTSEISRVIVTNNILVKSREAFLLLSWIQVSIWTGKTLPPEMTSSYWLSGTHTGPFHPYLSGHADPAYFEDGSSSVCLVNIDTAHNCCQCSLLFGYTFPLGNLISAPWFPCKLHLIIYHISSSPVPRELAGDAALSTRLLAGHFHVMAPYTPPTQNAPTKFILFHSCIFHVPLSE